MTIIFGALGLLLVLIISGMYIHYAFLASVLFLVYGLGYKTSFLLPYGYSVINSIVILCVPLFIAVGSIMDKSGIGKTLVNFVDLFLGRIRGGLAIVSIVACAMFGSISGSCFATLSCIGAIMFPRLEENGYPKDFSAALITCSSPLGLLIPPSASMIIYAWAGRQSVLACFLATVVPGIVLIIMLSITSLFLLRNNPNIKLSEHPKGKAFISLIRKRTISATPAMLMPIIILGGIYGGVFTPTEAASIAVIYAIPVGFFIYKGLTLKELYSIFVDSASTTGVVILLIFCVMMMSRIYIMEDLPGMITEFLKSFSDNKFIILIGVNIILLLLGMIMDDVSALMLTAPILIPVLENFGVHGVHFAAIVGVNLGMGLITPPTAPTLYFGAKVAGVSPIIMLKPTMIFLIWAWFPTLIAVTYFPGLSMWLPELVLGNF